ncbi:LysR family transcriptional regulator [bacterium]|nr:LysR family transcriptional regulator [bacterium]
MNLDWLRYFIVMSEASSLAQAAERLHVTPQALSNALAGLERHYQVKLLERGPRAKTLTPAGRTLRAAIPGILQAVDAVEQQLSDLQSEEPAGAISIGSTAFGNKYLLADALATLRARHRHLKPRLYGMVPAEQERWLAAGELDLIVLPYQPSRETFAARLLSRVPYVIVGRPQEPVPWHALEYVMPGHFWPKDGGCASERHMGDHWPADCPRNVVAEADQLESAIALVEAGVGAVFVPEPAVRAHVREGRLAVVADPPQPYFEEYYLAWQPNAARSAALRATIEVLTEHQTTLMGRA